MKYTYDSVNLRFTTDTQDSRWYVHLSPLRIRTPWFYLRIGRW